MVANSDAIEALLPLIKKAGQAVLKYYGHAGEVRYKEPNDSPITKADLASQEILIDGLAQFGYPVLSEEKRDDAARLQSKRVWIIDPLDGTKDFLQNTGEFSIMVGLVENGRPLLGVVYQPTTERLYYAVQGGGAYCEQGQRAPIRLTTSVKEDFKNVVMLVSRNHLLETEVTVAKQLDITRTRACGSVGVKVGLIASGEADLLINSSNKTGEWDSCASDCIVTEAGGVMTDMKGNPLQYNKEISKNLTGFVVSNGRVHDRVIAALQSITSTV